MIKLFTTFLILLSTTSIFSQSINGKISNDLGEPIPYTSIKVINTSIGTKTDMNGNFTLKLPNYGNCVLEISNLNYEKLKQTINVTSQDTIFNISLKSNNKKVKNVVVKGIKNKETESATLTEQKSQTVIKETIGAQEMSRKGASNAASAVAKIVGVSKSEGSNQIFVRGLGDRYNSTTLNGMFLPSDNPEFKNISLDYFPIEVIQSIGVSKTFNNTLFGDFGGATIDIATKEFVGKPAINIGYKLGVNSQAINNTIYGSGVSYLGAVNNTELPVANTGQYYSPQWNGTERNQPHINQEINLNGGWSKLFKNNSSISLFGTTSMSNKFEQYEGMTKTINAQNANMDSSNKKNSTYLVNNNLMLNTIYRLNDKLKFKANYLFFRTVSNQVNQYSGYNYNVAEANYKQRILKDISTLHIIQLLSEYKMKDNLNFNVGLSYNDITNNQPERTTYDFIIRNDKFIFNTDSKGDQNVYYQDLHDKDYTLNLMSSIGLGKVNEENKYNSNLTIGYTFRGKDREFSQYQYNFVPTNSNTLNVTPNTIQDFFTKENFDGSKYYVQAEREVGNNIKSNNYTGSLFVNSPSISIDHKFNKKLQILFGTRCDLIDQNVDWDVQSTSPTKGIIQFTNFKLLPYLNGKYAFNDLTNIKFAASKTYTLPQFKEMAPFLYIDINTFNSQGNPYLYASDNYNFDLKWEYFPKKNELISLSGFAKFIQNPINKVFIASSSSNTMSYINSGELAKVVGLEFEIKKNLLNHMDVDSTKLKYHLQGGFNISYLYSIQDLQNNKAATETNNYLSTIFNSTTSSLQGASPLLLNADLSYTMKFKKYEPTFSIVGNYFSDRLFVIGYQGIGDVYERGVFTLDFISKHTLNSKFSFSFNIKNILNPTIERYQEYKDTKVVVSTFKRGINASLGLNYNF